MKNELNIGIVGAGSFAAFAAKAFMQLEGVRIIAISDVNVQMGKQLAIQLNAEFYADFQDLLSIDRINMVYIATPPFLHYLISKKALQAGKHVLCEKPAALTTREAEELRLFATQSGLLYVVNLMQRYNPLYNVVKCIIDENILGDFLHGFFENYASDEYLNKEHWFWNESMSGGIFIEHGVHFFDMLSGWLGKGKVINAIQIMRPGVSDGLSDRVQATVMYRNGIVNFYHGFDQPKILDRQDMRLQFERGDITLYEWIPVRLKLHGLVSDNHTSRLHELLGPFDVHREDNRSVNKEVTGRFKQIRYDDLITIENPYRYDKERLYQNMLTDMLADQWQWIRNKEHIRVIDDNNAVESLRMAEYARETSVKI